MSTMQMKNETLGVLRVKLRLTIEESSRGIKYAYKTIKTFQGLSQSDAQLMADEFQRVNKGLTLIFEWQAYSVNLYTESTY